MCFLHGICTLDRAPFVLQKHSWVFAPWTCRYKLFTAEVGTLAGSRCFKIFAHSDTLILEQDYSYVIFLEFYLTVGCNDLGTRRSFLQADAPTCLRDANIKRIWFGGNSLVRETARMFLKYATNEY